MSVIRFIECEFNEAFQWTEKPTPTQMLLSDMQEKTLCT